MKNFIRIFGLLCFFSYGSLTVETTIGQNLEVEHNAADVAQFKSTTGTTRINLDGNYAISGSEKRAFMETNNTILRLSTSNNNTGGSIRFSTSGTGSASDKVTITNMGRLGIGTTAPNAKFQVFDNSSPNPFNLTTTGLDNYSGVYNSTGYVGYWGVFNGDYDMDFGTGGGNSTGKVNIVCNSQPKMTIENDGTVTINNQYELPTNDGGAGDVMTTDGAGVVSWQSGGGTGPNSGFRASLSTPLVVSYLTNTTVTNYAEITDTNNDFNPSTGTFTAPVNGFYQFNAHVYMDNANAADEKTIELKFDITGTPGISPTTYDKFSLDGGGGFGDSTDFSTCIYLNAGSTVSIRLFHDFISGINLPSTGSGRTTFSGFRVY